MAKIKGLTTKRDRIRASREKRGPRVKQSTTNRGCRGGENIKVKPAAS